MKKLIILLLWLAPALACGQMHVVMSFQSFFDKYAVRPGFASVNVSGDLARQMLAGMNGQGGKNVIRRVKTIKTLSTECAGAEFRKDLDEIIDLADYETLMVSRDDRGRTQCLRRKSGNGQEFLMIVLRGDTANIINIVGDIDLKDIHVPGTE